MSSPSNDILEHLLKSNCEIFSLPSHFDAQDMSDCRPALLKFMATATPDSSIASDILSHFSRHKDAMTITPVAHFTSPAGEQSIEYTVDNVPEAVNPVKSKLAYIQVPSQDGEGTDLHLVWKVHGFSIYLCHLHFYNCNSSSKLKCKTTGMKLRSPPLRLTRSSRSLIGPLMLLFPYLSPTSLPPITSLHGVSTILPLAIGQLRRKIMILWLHPLVGIHFPIRTIRLPKV